MSKDIQLIKGWEDLTLKQYQQIYSVANNKELDIYDKEDQILSILYGISIDEILNIDLDRYKLLRQSVITLYNTPIKPVLKRIIEVNGRAYAVEVDPGKLPNASAIAILKYPPKTEAGIIEILHYLLARAVRPVKKNLLGIWIKQPHSQKDAIDIYSQDLLDAKYLDIYGILYFYNAVILEWFKEYTKKIKA